MYGLVHAKHESYVIIYFKRNGGSGRIRQPIHIVSCVFDERGGMLGNLPLNS